VTHRTVLSLFVFPGCAPLLLLAIVRTGRVLSTGEALALPT
jgi:hypothetical protein